MRIVLLIFFAAVCLLRCKNVESPVAAIPMADVKDKPKPAPEVSLAGNVFDKEGHLPIWGATILVTGANAAGADAAGVGSSAGSTVSFCCRSSWRSLATFFWCAS